MNMAMINVMKMNLREGIRIMTASSSSSLARSSLRLITSNRYSPDLSTGFAASYINSNRSILFAVNCTSSSRMLGGSVGTSSSSLTPPSSLSLLSSYSCSSSGGCGSGSGSSSNQRRQYFSFRDLWYGEDKVPDRAYLVKDGLPRSFKEDGRYMCQWSQDITKKKDFFMSLKWFLRGGVPAHQEVLDDVLHPGHRSMGGSDAVQRSRQAFFQTCAVDLNKIKGVHYKGQENNSNSSNSSSVTWLGHSTCLFKVNGRYILSDPVWYDRCSPVSFYGPKRYSQPAVKLEDVPVDIVVLSHTHYDHFDVETIAKIGNQALWVVPLGVKNLLNRMDITNCIELDWWEDVVIPKSGDIIVNKLSSSGSSTSISEDADSSSLSSSSPMLSPASSSSYSCNSGGGDVKIVFTPTKHWTSRNPFDRNTCLWGSFAMLSENGNAFFTGDTAYCDVFKLIGERYGPFDIAAIPIGAYKPRFYMKNIHCNPQEAVMIHRDLRSKSSFGIHWGLFPLSEEDMIEPPLEMARARESLKIPQSEFFTLLNGETYVAGEVPALKLETQQKDVFASYKRYAKSSDFLADEEDKRGLVSRVKANLSFHRSKLSQRASLYVTSIRSRKLNNKNKNKSEGLLRRSITHQKVMLTSARMSNRVRLAASNVKVAASNIRAAFKNFENAK